MTRSTIRNAHHHITRQHFFNAGNLHGDKCNGYAPHVGQLPVKWRERLDKDRPVYVVYSYNTPIGWISEDGRYVVPPVNYSVTTSRHQAEVTRAWPVNPWWKLREPAPYELAN